MAHTKVVTFLKIIAFFLSYQGCLALTIYWDLIAGFQIYMVIYNDRFILKDYLLFCDNLDARNVGIRSTLQCFTQF